MMKFLNNKFANNERVVIKHNGYYYQGKVIGQKGISRIIVFDSLGESLIVKSNIFRIYSYYGTI
ncbi:hypothetical protein OUHCRE11_47080 [Enterobacter asburiae]